MTRAISTIAALAALSLLSNEAAAGYAGILGNHTKYTISYQVRSAIYKNPRLSHYGPWKTYTLRPGQKHYYYSRVTNPSETLQVRWDNYAGDGRVTFEVNAIYRHGTTRPQLGRYNFFGFNPADASGGRRIWLSH